MWPNFRIHSSGIAVTGSQDQDNCATECYLLQGPGAWSKVTYRKKHWKKNSYWLFRRLRHSIKEFYLETIFKASELEEKTNQEKAKDSGQYRLDKYS